MKNILKFTALIFITTICYHIFILTIYSLMSGELHLSLDLNGSLAIAYVFFLLMSLIASVAYASEETDYFDNH